MSAWQVTRFAVFSGVVISIFAGYMILVPFGETHQILGAISFALYIGLILAGIEGSRRVYEVIIRRNQTGDK